MVFEYRDLDTFRPSQEELQQRERDSVLRNRAQDYGPILNPAFQGFDASLRGMTAADLAAESTAAEAEGDMERASALRRTAAREAGLAEAAGPDTRSLRDIDGIGDAVNFVGGAVGSAAGSFLPIVGAGAAGTLAAGPWGGAAAGTAAAYDLIRDQELLSSLLDEELSQVPAAERRRIARNVATGGAALEAFVPLKVANRIRKMIGGGKGAGRAALREGVQEAATETAQAEFSNLGQEALGKEVDRDVMDYADAAATGFFGGAGVSVGATGARQALDAAGSELAGSGTRLADRATGAVDAGKQRVSEVKRRAGEFTKNRGSREEVIDLEELRAELRDMDPEDPAAQDLADKFDEAETTEAARARQEIVDAPDAPADMKRRATVVDLSDPQLREQVIADADQLQGTRAQAQEVIDLLDVAKEIKGAKKPKTDTDTATSPDSKASQDTGEPSSADLVSIVRANLTDQARANPRVIRSLPQLANALADMAEQYEVSELTAERVARAVGGMRAFKNPRQLADQVSKALGLEVEQDGDVETDSLLNRLANRNSAATDALAEDSFFTAMLDSEIAGRLSQAKKEDIGRVVDAFDSIPDGERVRGAMGFLSKAFGSADNARRVIEFYAGEGSSQRAAGIKEADLSNLGDTSVDPEAESSSGLAEDATTEEGGRTVANRFAGFDELDLNNLVAVYQDGDANRPFLKDVDDARLEEALAEHPGARAGTMAEYLAIAAERDAKDASDPGAQEEIYQRLLRNAFVDIKQNLEKRLAYNVSRDRNSQEQAASLLAQGDALPEATREIALKAQRRLAKNTGFEDRSAAIERLNKELKALTDAAGDLEQALGNYSVVMAPRDATDAASDEQLKTWKRGLDIKYRKPDERRDGKRSAQLLRKLNERSKAAVADSKVYFKRKDSKTPLVLSAQAMALNPPQRGQREGLDQQFADSVAAVLARPDIEGVANPDGSLSPTDLLGVSLQVEKYALDFPTGEVRTTKPGRSLGELEAMRRAEAQRFMSGGGRSTYQGETNYSRLADLLNTLFPLPERAAEYSDADVEVGTDVSEYEREARAAYDRLDVLEERDQYLRKLFRDVQRRNDMHPETKEAKLRALVNHGRLLNDKLIPEAVERIPARPEEWGGTAADVKASERRMQDTADIIRGTTMPQIAAEIAERVAKAEGRKPTKLQAARQLLEEVDAVLVREDLPTRARERGTKRKALLEKRVRELQAQNRRTRGTAGTRAVQAARSPFRSRREQEKDAAAMPPKAQPKPVDRTKPTQAGPNEALPKRSPAPTKGAAQRKMVSSLDPAKNQIPAREVREGKDSATRGRTKKASRDEQARVIKLIRKMRGNKVQVAIDKTMKELGAAGRWTRDPATGDRIINVALTAADPESVAYHEAMHDFFETIGSATGQANAQERRLKQSLLRAATSPNVRKQLRNRFYSQPKVLAAIENDPNEAIAYAYQLWTKGQLKLGPTHQNVFAKLAEMFRRVMRIVSEAEQLQNTFAMLERGDLKNPSTVAEVMVDRNNETLNQKLNRVATPMMYSANKLLNGATEQLKSFNSPTLDKLAQRFWQAPGEERGGLPFLPRRAQAQGQWLKRLTKILEGTTEAQRKEALLNMQAMKKPRSQLEKDLTKFFDEAHDYMAKAGVEIRNEDGSWEPIGRLARYFPRRFDVAYIQNNQAKFEARLRKYMTQEQAHAITQALIHGNGQIELAESEHHLGFTPFAEQATKRKLTFITEQNAEEFVEFQVKDLNEVLATYVQQMVHRAEYARMFGNDGQKIRDAVQHAQDREGLTQDEAAQVFKIIRGLEGTIHQDMPPAARQAINALITIENVILLPMAIFSQVVDPLNLAIRTGKLSDAGLAYKRALTDLGKVIKSPVKWAQGRSEKDWQRELTETLGIIDEQSMLEAMGQVYGGMYMSKTLRSINNAFFKVNGLQGWNNSMRVAATVAGERYLKDNKNDARALKELGLLPEDLMYGSDGRMLVTTEDIYTELRKSAHKNTPYAVTQAKAEATARRVQTAMFKFVDSAIIRPNSAHRPTWMSDPRFMLVGHLKQFTFSFHSVVLKRMASEAEKGNNYPMLLLAAYMPVMMASDMAKWTLTGSVPDSWTFGDYFWHAASRSGILGKWEFGGDVLGDLERGNFPGSDLLGPTVEHATELAWWIGGDPRTSIEDVIDRSIPFARYF